MRKIILLAIISFNCIFSFSQERERTYMGAVTDKSKEPIDVFTLIVFNRHDSTKHIYANTFAKGKFDFKLDESTGKDHIALLSSMGYEDMYIDMDKLGDTIVLRNKSIRVDDAVIKGRREVRSTLGDNGGIIYDVANTNLSQMGTSTMLLNFIPTVRATNDGDVFVVGIDGDVDIYINDVKVIDKEKLLSVKSEDIKSVEVVRNPGAKYKNVGAVILIKTWNRYEGFSSRVTLLGYLGKKNKYSLSPRAELGYNIGKVSISGAYNYADGTSYGITEKTNIIDESVIPGNWTIFKKNDNEQKLTGHWYNANIDYDINDKNFLNIQYIGRTSKTHSDDIALQKVFTSAGDLYDNSLAAKNLIRANGNTVHLYYRGKYSENFNVQVNADYSDRNNNSEQDNIWTENNNTPTVFSQINKTRSSAFTTELLFLNTIKKKHKLNYGIEYSYLKDRIRSNDMEGNPTEFRLNSHFIKTILEYKVSFNKIDLSLGGNYMYSRADNNTQAKDEVYNNIWPYFQLMYYDDKKELGVNFFIEYNNHQPNARLLNDITVNYISPYEISTGNSSINKSEGISTNVNINYKNFTFGLNMSVSNNGILSTPYVIIQENGEPLLVNRPVNLDKPDYFSAIYADYQKKVGIWLVNISVIGNYYNIRKPLFNGRNDVLAGFGGQINVSNYFELPKGFSIYLFGSYRTKRIENYSTLAPFYETHLQVEKRFFNDQLRIALECKGFLASKWDVQIRDMFGVYTKNKTHDGWYQHIGLTLTWRFNNHKSIMLAKENEYLNML